MTSSEPFPAVAQVPSTEGKLPTITKPSCNTPRAVDKPGWESDEVKKTESGPCCGTRTMVVPVPCRFWLLLKFDTRMSPGFKTPPGNPCGTNATPYGLTSPFWPMREGEHSYQMCLGWGIKRLFDQSKFRGYGPYGYDVKELIARARAAAYAAAAQTYLRRVVSVIASLEKGPKLLDRTLHSILCAERYVKGVCSGGPDG